MPPAMAPMCLCDCDVDVSLSLDVVVPVEVAVGKVELGLVGGGRSVRLDDDFDNEEDGLAVEVDEDELEEVDEEVASEGGRCSLRELDALHGIGGDRSL